VSSAQNKARDGYPVRLSSTNEHNPPGKEATAGRRPAGIDALRVQLRLSILALPLRFCVHDLRNLIRQKIDDADRFPLAVQGATLIIKLGVQGRVILGPMGGPGQVAVPLRYAVVREGPQPKTVVTKFKRISVTVAPGQTHVQFIDIEEGLSFPMPSRSELDAYVVYVGFDEIGDKNEKKQPAEKTATRQQ